MFTLIQFQRQRDAIASVHRTGCRDIRREAQEMAGIIHDGHETAQAAVDFWIDDEMLEMGWTADDVKVHNCATTKGSRSNKAKEADMSKNTNPNVCRCGCAEATSSSKTLYKPGHDARHAGNVARAIFAGASESALTELPTMLLQAKASAMVARLAAKAEGKSAKRSKSVEIPAEVVDTNGNRLEDERQASVKQFGTVKAGRWFYPARRFGDGSVQRNAKRDGSGEWVEFDSAKPFQAWTNLDEAIFQATKR